MKRILKSGETRMEHHRADFWHCPRCGHKMEFEDWDKAATKLILDPSCYKSGNAAVVSECPKCFSESWVHHRLDCFSEYDETWPKKWIAAVQKRAAEVKLAALRKWGAGLCHQCKHLTEGAVDFQAWRHCIVGSGPPLSECKKFKKEGAAP